MTTVNYIDYDQIAYVDEVGNKLSVLARFDKDTSRIEILETFCNAYVTSKEVFSLSKADAFVTIIKDILEQESNLDITQDNKKGITLSSKFIEYKDLYDHTAFIKATYEVGKPVIRISTSKVKIENVRCGTFDVKYKVRAIVYATVLTDLLGKIEMPDTSCEVKDDSGVAQELPLTSPTLEDTFNNTIAVLREQRDKAMDEVAQLQVILNASKQQINQLSSELEKYRKENNSLEDNQIELQQAYQIIEKQNTIIAGLNLTIDKKDSYINDTKTMVDRMIIVLEKQHETLKKINNKISK